MSNDCKVLHFVSLMNRGGEETFIMNVYRNVNRSKVQFDFLVVLSEKGDYDDEIQMLGGNIYHLKINRIKGPAKQVDNAFILYRFLKQHVNEYVAFHIHTQHAMDGFLSGTAAKLAGIRKVIVHSHNSDTIYHRRAHFVFRPFFEMLNVYRFACSDAAGKWLHGRRSFQIINNGIDTKAFGFDSDIRNKIRTDNGWTDKYIIGHVGRFNKQKNHIFLIAIFEKVLELIPESELVLIGTGEEESGIRQLVDSKGLGEKVHFMGKQSHVIFFYQGMDLFLFPSLYEGLGIVVIEAQCAGLPCVLSDEVPLTTRVTELTHYISLSDKPEKWARQIKLIADSKTVRCDHSEMVRDAGFEISTTAKKLENFYLN